MKIAMIIPEDLIDIARQYNITPIIIRSGEEAFISGIKEAIRIAQDTRNEKEINERIKVAAKIALKGKIN